MRKPKVRSYDKLVKAFEFNNDNNYCTRLAFCVMTGLSAGKSIAYCKRMVSTWEGKGQGLSLEEMEQFFGQPANHDYDWKQFRTVAKELAAQGGKYVVVTASKRKGGHAVAIRDGQIVDFTEQSDRTPVIGVFDGFGLKHENL
jgi:hypothetical protein